MSPWLDEDFARLLEENLRGKWRDSQSLKTFQEGIKAHYPIPKRIPSFGGIVLSLADRGLDLETARWAAGQATSRLPETAEAEAICTLALEILREYREAA